MDKWGVILEFKNFVLKAAETTGDELLIKKVQSDQFKMAGEIIDLTIKLGLDQKETAKALNVPYNYLIDIEDADLNIGIEEYNDVYKRLLEISDSVMINKK